MPHQQCDRDSEIGDGVEQEHESGAAEREDQTGQRRPDRASRIHRHAAQRCGVRDLISRYQLRLYRLECRRGQRRSHTEQEGQDEQPRGIEVTGVGQQRHHRADQRRIHRGHHQQPLAIEEVGEDSREQGQHECRREAGRLHQRDHRWPGVIVHQEPLGADGLHPESDIRHELRDEQIAKDVVLQRFPGGCHAHSSVRGASPARDVVVPRPPSSTIRSRPRLRFGERSRKRRPPSQSDRPRRDASTTASPIQLSWNVHKYSFQARVGFMPCSCPI